MRLQILNLIVVLTLSLTYSFSFAHQGGVADTGGGDAWTTDFLNIARNELIPWLYANEASPEGVKLPVSAKAVESAVNPRQIKSLPFVYEKCRTGMVALTFFSQLGFEPKQLSGIQVDAKDREVSACYDGQYIYISRKMWPLGTNYDPRIGSDEGLRSVKRGLVAHEIFRKMNIGEGDNYTISEKIPILSVNTTTSRNLNFSYMYGSALQCLRASENFKSVGAELKQLCFQRYALKTSGDTCMNLVSLAGYGSNNDNQDTKNFEACFNSFVVETKTLADCKKLAMYLYFGSKIPGNEICERRFMNRALNGQPY